MAARSLLDTVRACGDDEEECIGTLKAMSRLSEDPGISFVLINTKMRIQKKKKTGHQSSVLPTFRERVCVLDLGSWENTARGVPNARSTTQSPMMNMKRIKVTPFKV
jgi:hypothetical protein